MTAVALAECPHCGRLVAEQSPGSAIVCATCGSSSPDAETWNRRVWRSADERAALVGVACAELGLAPPH